MSTQEFSKNELWNEMSFRSYLGEVKRKCGVVETLALPSLRDLPAIQIETLFVPPLICTVPVHADDDPDDWPVGKNLLDELQESKQIVVLGDPGGGKTTLSNWLAWRLASGSSAPLPPVLQNKVPIPCILREMPHECFEKGFSVGDLAVAVVNKLVGEVKAEQVSSVIYRWVAEGKYALILDGIDEVAVQRRQIVASWIKEANRQQAVVLATSRIVGYEDYSVDCDIAGGDSVAGEFNAGLNIGLLSNAVKRAKSATVSSQSVHIGQTVRGKERAKLRYLMPFNKEQISDFARNWYNQRCVSELEAKQRTSDLLAALSQSEITEKLARTPNLLSLMAIVHRERAHLPDGKALLYDEIVNAYLNTIDTQRKIGDGVGLSEFSWKDKKSWLAYVGFKLQESRDWHSSTAGIIATETQVLEWLEEAIRSSGVEDYQSVANEFLSWVARRSGLLLPRGENRYAFVHLSFQEYFCAHHLAGAIVKPAFVMDKIKADALVTKDKVCDWGSHPAWLETYIFLFETLSAEHGFDWVETLIQIVFSEDDDGLSNLAARLVKNKHVKLPGSTRDELAERCVSAVYSEADYKTVPDSEVFRSLVESGYAIFITGDDAGSGKHAGEESAASKVIVIVAVEGANLSRSFLEKYKSLQALSVIDGKVDINGLSEGGQLKYLRLRDVNILNYGQISCLKSLQSLELRRVNVGEISSLLKLKSLTSLELAEVNLKDLSPLASLRNIGHLEVSNIPSKDLSPIGLLKKLKTLYLMSLDARSIEFISGLSGLRNIHLSRMKIEDFTPLAACKNLSSLDITFMDCVDLKPVSSLKKLAAVFLTSLGQCDVSPLANSKELTVLMLDELSVSGLKDLAVSKKLHNVYFDKVVLDDLTSLSGLRHVRALTLKHMPEINDLDFLRDFKGLRYLNIVGMKLKNVDALRGFSAPFGLRLSKRHGLDIDFLLDREGFDISIDENDEFAPDEDEV